MIEKIEVYGDILKVILKPTKKFPVGYFYCNGIDEDLVKSMSWCLSSDGSHINVLYNRKPNHYIFHRELAYKYLGYYPDFIAHRNGVDIDNVDSNLDVVTKQQYSFNRPTRGYYKDGNLFVPKLVVDSKIITYSGVVTELEACQLQHELESSCDYMYDFLLDRRDSVEILDLERTGKISEEEAVYKHVLKHANAWHYFRFNLQDYFKDNHLPVPSYNLDEKGFLVDKITGKRLCPF